MGAVRLVERLRISLPWTTMLSFDFLRSRVSISEGLLAYGAGPAWIRPTIPARVEVYYRPYADIDDAQEALVLLLELLLVKDLNREDALFVHFPVSCVSVMRKRGRRGPGTAYMSKLSFQ